MPTQVMSVLTRGEISRYHPASSRSCGRDLSQRRRMCCFQSQQQTRSL